MPGQRRNFTGAEKIAILRQHLIDKVAISELCDKHGLQPTLLYQWQKKLFEDGAAIFESGRGKAPRQQAGEHRRIEALESKLQQKNEVLAELMGDHVALKKSLGQV